MANAGPYQIILDVKSHTSKTIKDLRSPRGLFIHGYTASLTLRLPSPQQAERFKSFPFRLDTGTVTSVIPKEWYRENLVLLGPLSKELKFDTVAGKETGIGRMASRIPAYFPSIPDRYLFDFFVSESFAKDYGLLSLRDALNNFQISTDGPLRFAADGQPWQLPRLILTTRTDRHQR